MFSIPMLSVFGFRPTATRSFSNSISSLFPLASVAVRLTLFAFRRMFSAFAPVSTRMPAFLKDLSSSFEISSSSTGTSRGQHLQYRDLCAEAVENGSKLDTYGAGADNSQRIRHAGRSRISILVRIRFGSG